MEELGRVNGCIINPRYRRTSVLRALYDSMGGAANGNGSRPAPGGRGGMVSGSEGSGGADGRSGVEAEGVSRRHGAPMAGERDEEEEDGNTHAGFEARRAPRDGAGLGSPWMRAAPVAGMSARGSGG